MVPLLGQRCPNVNSSNMFGVQLQDRHFIKQGAEKPLAWMLMTRLPDGVGYLSSRTETTSGHPSPAACSPNIIAVTRSGYPSLYQ
jgi:hypothetical protein